MPDKGQDLWATMVNAMGECLNDRCKDDPPTVADSATKLYDTLLLLAYDPNTTDTTALRISNVIRNAFLLGRVMERLAQTLKK